MAAPQTAEEPTERTPLTGVKEEDATSKFSFLKYSIAINMLAVIIFGSSNKVVYKIMLVPMQHYTFFVGMVSSILYTTFYFSIVWTTSPRKSVILEKFFRFKKEFFMMGCFDAFSTVLGMIAARNLAGMVFTLLPKIVIPLTMIASVLMLNRRYNFGEVLGSMIVLGGIAVVVVGVHGTSSQGDVLSVFLFLFSIFPSAVSFVLREQIFIKDPSMNPFIVSLFSSLFQLVWSILMLPLSSLPEFGNIPLARLPSYFVEGFQCWAGVPISEVETCFGNPWAVLAYHTINILWNSSIIILLRKGNAVLLFMVNTVAFPLSNLAFALKWPLIPREEFSVHNVIGLLLELGGVVLFEYSGKKKAEKEKEAVEGTDKPESEQKLVGSTYSSTASSTAEEVGIDLTPQPATDKKSIN